MLVILTKEQLLSPQTVCPSCLLADRQGQPRWQQGQLCCGQLLNPWPESGTQCQQYQCQMGFRLTHLTP
ncbi:MAG: hypothetical protein HC934_08625 [Acaryochloridaceae cyanobacterium SU_2_1]|nr:hypothetical protein [Acaryochloridaceae cyanobacterium SU_2_1]